MTGHGLLAMALSAIGASMADWFFFGVWMHGRYLAFPEIWRWPMGGPGESRAVLWSALASTLTSVGFVSLCAMFAITSLDATLAAAALSWLAFPVPILVTNMLFIKMDPVLVVPHLLGWLVRLLLTAVVVAWLL